MRHRDVEPGDQNIHEFVEAFLVLEELVGDGFDQVEGGHSTLGVLVFRAGHSFLDDDLEEFASCEVRVVGHQVSDGTDSRLWENFRY